MRILVTDPISKKAINYLKESGLVVDVMEDISYDELLRIVRGYDVLIVRGRTRVDKKVIDEAVNLKLIGRCGVGLDNIDVEYAVSRGIKVLNTPEATATSVAELTLGLMLCVSRLIHIANDSLKGGKWLKKKLLGFELCGKTVGLIGFGRIGREVAKRASALGMKVLALAKHELTLNETTPYGAQPAGSLDYLLSASDIISLHIPLTPETYHYLNWREFELMKDGVVIINTARWNIINPEALLNALDSGKVSWAAIDVFENEPPKCEIEWKIIRHPRVLVTQHIGAQTMEAQKRAGIMLAEKILKELGKS